MSSSWPVDGDCIEVGSVPLILSNPSAHPSTQAFLQQYPPAEQRRDLARIAIQAQSDGLHVLWRDASSTVNSATNKRHRAPAPLDIHIDLKALLSLPSFPAAKQGAFNQALGKKTKIVIDATGGWGSDALLMCSQGYEVHIIERNPVMAVLLSDAMQRLTMSDWAAFNKVSVPTVHFGEAQPLLLKLSQELQADCVYLDPMFPAKRKKSAAVNKKMAFLAQLVGEDLDATDVLQAALQNAYPRVAVKRPDYAQALSSDTFAQTPSVQFSSKLVHYDVYFA